MSFSTHPQNLTKDRLKEDLLNKGVQLPTGNVVKSVLVDLYIRHLTPCHKEVPEERSEFSDDEPLTPNKSPRKKAIKKMSRNITTEVDSLTDEELFAKLDELGEAPGPITDTTRKLYRRKLAKLLADPNQLKTEDVEEVEVVEEVEEYSDEDMEDDDEEVIEETVVEETEEEPVVEEEDVVLVDDNGQTKRISTVTTTTTTTTTIKKRAGKTQQTTIEDSKPAETASVTNGHSVPKENPETDVKPKEKPPTKPRSSRKVMYTFVFLLLLAVLAGLLVYHMEENPLKRLPGFKTPVAKSRKPPL